MRSVRTWLWVFALLAAPAAAQMAPMMRAVQPSPQVVIDYQAQYQQEVEKNKALRGENTSLKAQLAAFASRGGSRVTAYCETPVLSRNTTGASNDCSNNGFGCEPVSGLCRTSAHSSDECAAGYVYCSVHANCVRSADECRSD
jgi:hypothetical protein